MSCVNNCGIIRRNPENMHSNSFIIVAHLDGDAFIRKLIVKFSYCVLTALILLFVNVIIGIEVS